jgi:hypothetical protein
MSSQPQKKQWDPRIGLYFLVQRATSRRQLQIRSDAIETMAEMLKELQDSIYTSIIDDLTMFHKDDLKFRDLDEKPYERKELGTYADFNAAVNFAMPLEIAEQTIQNLENCHEALYPGELQRSQTKRQRKTK